MVSTDHDLQVQQRRQESRAFILRALNPIAAALGEGLLSCPKTSRTKVRAISSCPMANGSFSITKN